MTRLLPRFLNHQAETSKVWAKSAMFWGSKREGRAVHCFYGRFPHCVPCLVEDRFGVIGPETAERDREIARMVEWTGRAFVYSMPVCGKFQPKSFCLSGTWHSGSYREHRNDKDQRLQLFKASSIYSRSDVWLSDFDWKNCWENTQEVTPVDTQK